jgi:membrane fusion protein (multidrug efflux system)
MKMRMTLALGAGIVMAAACGKKEAAAPPPPDVKVATVLQKDVPIYVEAIGQTRGSTEIEVRARVEGFLQTVDFKEGNPVRQGQLLYTIDPRPFQAALAQSKGQLAQAEPQLARAH